MLIVAQLKLSNQTNSSSKVVIFLLIPANVSQSVSLVRPKSLTFATLQLLETLL